MLSSVIIIRAVIAVANLSLEAEKDHSKDILKRFATKENNIEKDAAVKIGSKKRKRDTTRTALHRHPTKFPHLQPEYTPVVKRNTNTDAISTTASNGNASAVFGDSKTHVFATTIKTAIKRESHHHKNHKRKDHKTPLVIHIEETMGLVVTSTEKTEVLEDLIPFMSPNVEDVVPADVPYVFDDWEVNHNGDSKNNFYGNIKYLSVNEIKPMSSKDIEVISPASSASHDIDEQDIENDLFQYSRLGRNAQSAVTISERSGDDEDSTRVNTPSVKYEGTLVATSENNNKACTTNEEISEKIFGPDTQADKMDWVSSHKNSICDYNKFQICKDREELLTTTSKEDSGASKPDPVELSKTYCGCISNYLNLVGDTCVIPAGKGTDSKCPVTVGLPAGQYKGSTILKASCTPHSECVQRAEFFGSRCVCKPNIKLNSKTFTCGNAPNTIFYPIFQCFLVLGALGTIFAL